MTIGAPQGEELGRLAPRPTHGAPPSAGHLALKGRALGAPDFLKAKVVKISELMARVEPQILSIN